MCDYYFCYFYLVLWLVLDSFNKVVCWMIGSLGFQGGFWINKEHSSLKFYLKDSLGESMCVLCGMARSSGAPSKPNEEGHWASWWAKVRRWGVLDELVSYGLGDEGHRAREQHLTFCNVRVICKVIEVISVLHHIFIV